MSEETGVAVWEKAFEFKGSNLIPKPESVSSLALPQDVVGRENMDVDDLIVPSLALLQATSEAVTSGVSKPGLFLHSNSGEIIEPPVKALIVHYHKSNAFFPPQGDAAKAYPELEGKETCLSRDAQVGTRYGTCEDCRLCLDWFEDGRKPAGAVNHVFTLITDEGPATIRFSRSSYKAGSQFLSNWGFTNKNLWHHPVEIIVIPKPKELSGGRSTFYQTMVMRWIKSEETPQAWVEVARKAFDTIRGAHDAGKFSDELENTPGEFDE